MLKWFSSLLPGSPQAPQIPLNLRVILPEQHQIDIAQISPNAVTVMRRLHEAGYDSYLVGGGVRDLLLDARPKDFDVATDATPEQIKKVFRNARIIGRRFKIVHVRYGREIIEVTTFRGQDKDSAHHKQSASGQLLRDNVYGDIESDAVRRDFTANALYYSAVDETLHDFVGGLEDILERRLKMIGDPAARYTEDPVRLLRAIRFSAKLGFRIDQATAEPIRDHAQLLANVPPARLFEEVLKLFLAGYATATFQQLNSYGLFAILFPQSALVTEEQPAYLNLIEQVMINTDKRIRTGKRVTPAFIYAALLWPALHHELQVAPSLSGQSRQDRFYFLSQQVIDYQLLRIMIPKRFLVPMRQIWELQNRLGDRVGKRAWRTLEHPKFRAGYDFLLLREQAGEDLEGLGSWWTQFQHADADEQQIMVSELKLEESNKRRRPRRRRSSKRAAND